MFNFAYRLTKTDNMKNEQVYLVDWVSKTMVQLTNLEETIIVNIESVNFLGFNRLYATLNN